MSEERLDELLSRYGTTALAIARHRGRWTDADRLPDSVGYSLAEIDWITRNERVVHLADIVMRRTTLAVTGALTTRDLAAIAAVAGEALGWDASRTAQEIATVTTELSGRHRSRLLPEVIAA